MSNSAEKAALVTGTSKGIGAASRFLPNDKSIRHPEP